MLKRLLPLLCVAASLFGQQPSGAASTAATSEKVEKKGIVSGQVVSITGEPLNKADVTLRKDGRDVVSISTDTAGAFTFKDVEPGRYMLSAQRTGYVKQDFGAKGTGTGRTGTALRVSAGQELNGLVVKLMRQAVISGKVTDEDGEPIGKAIVSVMTPRYVRGKRQLVPTSALQADDLGEYRIGNLAPGKYVVSAAPARMNMTGAVQAPPAKEGPEEGYTAMYYPLATDPAQASPLEVGAGNDLRSIDFRLKKTQVYRVKGKVIEASSGKAADQTMVMLLPGSMENLSGIMNRVVSMVRGADGVFELTSVVPGSYTLTAMRITNPAGGMTAQMPVEVTSSNIDGLTLIVGASVELTGSVRVEGTQTKPVYGQMRIALEPSQGIPISQPNTTVGEDGSFKFASASPGKYKVNTTNLPEGTYLKSIRVGNQDLTNSPIDLSNGAPGALEILLSATAATVEGTVYSPKKRPVPGVRIALVPESSKRDNWGLYKSGITDQAGVFQLKGIAPGEYVAMSWEEVEEDAWQSAEYLAKYERQGQKLKLGESAKENVEVKIIPAENSALDKEEETKDQKK